MAFTQRWTDEQRRACALACVDHGLTADEATRRAHEGALPVNAAPDAKLDPFPIPAGTVRDLATKERRERRAVETATTAPADLLGKQLGELGSLYAAQVRRAKFKHARGKLEPDAVGKLAKSGQELARFAAALNTKGTTPPPETPAGKDAAPGNDDFIGSLARETGANAKQGTKREGETQGTQPARSDTTNNNDDTNDNDNNNEGQSAALV